MSVAFKLFDPLCDFEERLPRKPYYGTSKKIAGITTKENAKDYPYIQANFPLLHYLTFDIDKGDAAIRSEEVGLPGPTLTVFDPDTGRGHLMYELLEPIPRRKSRATNSLLRDVVSGYTGILDADRCITTERILVKNPLCNEWEVIPGYKPFFLYELMESVPDEVKRNNRREIPYQHIGPERFEETLERIAGDPKIPGKSRNCAVFENARLYSYSIVQEHATEESLYNSVLDYIEGLNQKEIPEHFSHKGKLGTSELRSIAKSISRWTFERRAQYSVARGAMQLPAMEGLKKEEHNIELTRRQKLSAERTHNIRREDTKLRIIQGIYLCIKRGYKVNAANMRTLAGVSRRTFYYYKGFIEELLQGDT